MKNYLLELLFIFLIVIGCSENNNYGNNFFSFNERVSMPQTQVSLPNIVLIYIDDLGYGDIGPYGCKDIPTPYIDQLATEGVRFSASYITNPPCSPSRSSLIMGQYAQKFGKYGMSRGLAIPNDRPTLAMLLSKNGYVTG